MRMWRRGRWRIPCAARSRKDCHEIVGWRFSNEKSLQNIKKRAGREGGQVLVTESGDAQGASGLHALTSGLDDNIPPSGEISSPGAENTGNTGNTAAGEADTAAAESLADTMRGAIRQKFGSGNTSLRQVAAGFSLLIAAPREKIKHENWLRIRVNLTAKTDQQQLILNL